MTLQLLEEFHDSQKHPCQEGSRGAIKRYSKVSVLPLITNSIQETDLMFTILIKILEITAKENKNPEIRKGPSVGSKLMGKEMKNCGNTEAVIW